jgi:superfamily I DNA and RNA helicase
MPGELETVLGRTRNPFVTRALLGRLRGLQLTGTLYTGYPVLATAEEPITVDALLVSQEYGLIAFVISDMSPRVPADWESIAAGQFEVLHALQANLQRHKALWKGRELAVAVNLISLLPESPECVSGDESLLAAEPDGVQEALARCVPFDPRYTRPLNAALESITNLKPQKRRSSVSRPNSRGAMLKEIEREIANLDKWQKKAAIECPEGPQRIRGLAGSGKTIILARKAAYLHRQHPDWVIALTFHTRSLYQQFTDLVRRFSYDQSGDEPDWTKLRITHAWGSSRQPGLYAEMAARHGADVRNYQYAKYRYGRGAFAGICRELITATEGSPIDPIYDAVLIDEAQDLPWQFFRLVHRFTREPKRIIWAYDELQNLTDIAMPSVEELFGVKDDGTPVADLRSADGEPQADVILPVCYRNTPWALTAAHALGFGLCRDDGLVQHFDDPRLWDEVGYSVLEGNLEPGERVTLKRRENAHPSYIFAKLSPQDALTTNVFETETEQAQWVASQVQGDIATGELEPDDILIVLPDVIAARQRAANIVEALAGRGIASHIVGVTESADHVFSPDSVAIAHVYRAKGNEASMVYVVDCDYCNTGYELIKVRNILFTAMTRSKAWVRLCGIGDGMRQIEAEVQRIRDHGYQLEFTIPTTAQLQAIRTIHRDRTAREMQKIRDLEKGLEEFVDAVTSGEIVIDNLPPPLRSRLRRLLRQPQEQEADDDDAE